MRARMLALVVCLAPLAVAEPAVIPEARAKFRAGVALMSDPDGARVEEAYRLFKEAYAMSPSWKMLGNLGMSAMRLERHGEAIETLQRYLSEGGAEIDPIERAQVERDLRTLKSGSGVLSVTLPAGEGAVLLEDVRMRADGGRVSNGYTLPRAGTQRLVVALGRHKLTVTENDRTATWEGEVGTSGASIQLAFAPPTQASSAPPALVPQAPVEASHATRHAPTIGLVATGVGGAMLLTGVVTGILGQRKQIALDEACPDKTCPESRRGDVDTLRRYTTATNVFLIGGAAVTVAGLTTVALTHDTAVAVTPQSVSLTHRFR